jgi:hypothetical protein
MVEIGQIQKPSADDYIGKKKLYCVANIYAIHDAADEYKRLITKYWDEVAQQIEKVEAAGKINKIFCELISQIDDEEMKFLEHMNDRIADIISKKKEEGGTLIPLEDKEILGPYTDWGNCLRVVFTQDVFMKVLEFYNELSQKRLDKIMNIINSNLSEQEAGLLIMKDEDRAKLQFPKDIEVFLITPPSYDDLMRWIRDQYTKRKSEGTEQETETKNEKDS